MTWIATGIRMWAYGVRAGAGTLAREPLLGFKRLALPVSYWRAAEFAYAWQRLSGGPPARILDLGSPKDFATYLARRGHEVVATDILPQAIALSARVARAQGLEGRGRGRVYSEVQDGRSLTYPDASFDAAVAISVLEHIPDDGDSRTIRELVRIVRPGGRVVITTPYDVAYRETFVAGPVYERAPQGHEPLFFERHYDAPTLHERLMLPSRARLEHCEIWGERAIRAERGLRRWSWLGIPLAPLEAPLAWACLRPDTGDGRLHPMAVFFTLVRPDAPC